MRTYDAREAAGTSWDGDPGRVPANVRTAVRRGPLVRMPELRPSDALLPLSLVLWLVSVRGADADAMNDWGLFSALPVLFFVAVALLLVSIVRTLTDDSSSSLRLGVHLAALVVVLHGTVPPIVSVPNYPWVYKHIGVVEYINANGRLDETVDIYHNWPGFFAAGAWMSKIAGAWSPITFAAWAPVYFNLITCLVLAFVFRHLPVDRKTRWVALFLFVPANWVGQDYFAPQASAVVLSITVFGIALRWMQIDRPIGLVRTARRVAHATRETVGVYLTPDDASTAVSWARAAAIAALIVVFTIVVVTHQLSPYMVIFGVGVLTVAGLLRPWWVVVVMAAIAGGYLTLHISYVEGSQDLLGPLFESFLGLNTDTLGVRPQIGRRITALGAPLLMLAIWSLAIAGAVRRLLAGRSVLLLLLLAASPVIVAFGQSYGGEAFFRIYLFSLPWIVLLGGAAIVPSSHRRMFALKLGVVLPSVVVLFMAAFFGAEVLYRVRPGEVDASRYLYEHADPGSLTVFGAPHFPGRVAANYDEFPSSDSSLNLLATTDRFRRKMLGPRDVPQITTFVEEMGGRSGEAYLVLTDSQRTYAEVLGLLPAGSLTSLDRALARSPDWGLWCRNDDAAIYRLRPPEPSSRPTGCRPTPPRGAAPSHSALVVMALLGAGALTSAYGSYRSRR